LHSTLHQPCIDLAWETFIINMSKPYYAGNTEGDDFSLQWLYHMLDVNIHIWYVQSQGFEWHFQCACTLTKVLLLLQDASYFPQLHFEPLLYQDTFVISPLALACGTTLVPFSKDPSHSTSNVLSHDTTLASAAMELAQLGKAMHTPFSICPIGLHTDLATLQQTSPHRTPETSHRKGTFLIALKTTIRKNDLEPICSTVILVTSRVAFGFIFGEALLVVKILSYQRSSYDFEVWICITLAKAISL